jgi:hypothetical protein
LAIRENQPNFAQNRQEAILSGELGSQLTPYTRGFRDLGAGETRIEDPAAERVRFELSIDFVNPLVESPKETGASKEHATALSPAS